MVIYRRKLPPSTRCLPPQSSRRQATPCDKHPGHPQQTGQKCHVGQQADDSNNAVYQGCLIEQVSTELQNLSAEKKIKCLKKSHRLLMVFQNIKCISLIFLNLKLLDIYFFFCYSDTCIEYVYIIITCIPITLLHLIFFCMFGCT